MKPKNNSNELHLIRVYDAPVKMVWDAWTNPQQAAKWWGPRGFTITTHSKDLKPGGHWKYTMHGPDGVDYPNHTVYHEVEEQARLVYDHGGSDDRPPLFRVDVTFKENNGKTTMDMRMILATPEIAAETAKFIKQAGGNSTWDRLAEYLDQESTGRDSFVINRSFEVPVEKMFELWTNPEHFAQWLPPTGFTQKFIEADLRPGGTSFFRMDGNGITMYGKFKYHEITRPDRLVYSQWFCDEKGEMSRHPLAPTWPAVMRTTVTFTAEDTDTTRVTVFWEIEGEATAAERETFRKERAGMTQGWTGSFDKLEGYLARG